MRFYISISENFEMGFDAAEYALDRYNIQQDFLISFWWFFGKYKDKTDFLKINFSDDNTLNLFRKHLKKTDSKVLLDSGVYSARKKKVNISNEMIIDFYHKNSDIISYVFTNDEGTGKQQIENTRILKSEGVPVIGIYHPGDTTKPTMDLKDLDELIDICQIDGKSYISYSYFQVPGRDIERASNTYFNHIYSNYKLEDVRSHILGIESSETLLQYPFYSTDSAGFAINSYNGRQSFLDMNDLKYKHYKYNADIKKLISTDINKLNIFADAYQDQRRCRYLYNILERGFYQKFITQVWEKRGVSWE
jgi:hypothetical protein